MPPSPVYKGGEEEAGNQQGARQGGGLLLPVGVGLPPFLVQEGEEGKRRVEKEGEGGAPLPLSNSDWARGGHLWLALSLLH